MKEKIKALIENSKPMIKKVTVITVLSLSIVSGFSVGYLYHRIYGPKSPTIEMISLDKSQVNLAIDENNHLIIIDKNNGNYTVYEDSIGVANFNMYARNVIVKSEK